MNKRVAFFLRYYLKKHLGYYLGSPVTSNDLFRKRFYRDVQKVRGKTIKEEINEVIYEIEALPPLRVYIRTGLSSDAMVFGQVFNAKEYAPLLREIGKRKKEGDIYFVIDAGANVGYTSLMLKRAFPQTFLLAVEPDAGNATQLEKNFRLNDVQDYQIIQGGLWTKEGWLKLRKDKSKGEEWGFYVEESDTPTEWAAYTLCSLMNISGYPLIDILKIDIEGAEQELFKDEKSMTEVLAKTRFFAMEIHDDVADRQGIHAMLRKCNFSFFEEGELTIATNLSLL